MEGLSAVALMCLRELSTRLFEGRGSAQVHGCVEGTGAGVCRARLGTDTGFLLTKGSALVQGCVRSRFNTSAWVCFRSGAWRGSGQVQ